MDSQILEILDMIKDVGAPVVGVLLSFKFLLNGMRDDVKEIKVDVKDVKGTVTEHTASISRLEGWREAVDR